jgi:hypothetical protein
MLDSSAGGKSFAEACIGQHNVRRPAVVALVRVREKFIGHNVLHNYAIEGLMILSLQPQDQSSEREHPKQEDRNYLVASHLKVILPDFRLWSRVQRPV